MGMPMADSIPLHLLWAVDPFDGLSASESSKDNGLPHCCLDCVLL